MRRYQCIKSFWTEDCDGDGFRIENSETEIEKGKIYQLDESSHRMIGGVIHLDCEDDGSWIEIPKETLKSNFERLIEF